MRLETLTRRKELLKNRNLGVSLTDSVKILSRKFGVSERCVYQDWANRKQWLPLVLDIDDPRKFFLDILSQHREIYRLASLEYLKGDNSAARVGALRLCRDLNLDFVELITLREIEERLTGLEQQKAST